MTAPRVVFIGLDAMDAHLVDSLVDKGRLPHLSALIERSLRGMTRVPDGLVVGSVWPTIWSGTRPGTHGFYCFRQFVPGTYEVRRHTPAEIGVEPFWMTLADHGKQVVVVDMPLSPPTAPERGVHLVDVGTHDRMLPPSGLPAALYDQLMDRHGPHPADRCDLYTTDGRQTDAIADLVAGTRWRVAVGAELMPRAEDLFATVFSESHCAGHQLWCMHDPSWPTYDPSGGDALVTVYEAIDQAVGDLLARIGDDAHVAVLMSHGIGAHHDGDHLMLSIVSRLQSAHPDGPPARSTRNVERLRRRLDRAIRTARGRRHPEDPRFHRVTSVDGAQRFFVVPNNGLFGAIRLNLVGREPRGRVHPGADAERLLTWLADELLRLVDPATGRPVVRRVLRTDDLYPGTRRDHLPDLLIDWERSAPIVAATSPTIGLVEGASVALRSGDHRLVGRLLMSGRGLPAGELGRPIDLIDIAPTMCAWLGVEMPTAEGRAIPEALMGTTLGT